VARVGPNRPPRRRKSPGSPGSGTSPRQGVFIGDVGSRCHKCEYGDGFQSGCPACSVVPSASRQLTCTGSTEMETVRPPTSASFTCSDITNEPTPWPLGVPRARNPGDFCGGAGGSAPTRATSRLSPYYGSSPSSRGSNAAPASSISATRFTVESRYFIPAPTRTRWLSAGRRSAIRTAIPKINSACTKVIQTTNVEVDEPRPIYSADRRARDAHHPDTGARRGSRENKATQ